jgi:hypothetical protein
MLLLIGCDCAIGVLTVFAIDENIGEGAFYFFVMSFYTAMGAIIACFFFYHFYLLIILSLKYLKISDAKRSALGESRFHSL